MGTAIVKATPDEMDWMVTINANDATLAKAKARHDASLAAALKYLQSLGGALKDLQTGGIRFDHNLYPGDSAYARRNPYSCSTQFTFTLTDFDQYGPIADALARMDGAQVYSVTYASSKEADLRREALKRALLDGHDKARDLAETAGGTIDQPLSVDEQEAYNVTPETMNVVMGSTSAAATPAAVAGQIAFCAKVVASYDFLPR
ncbi:MAG: SIMPL domain-containing protein [Verrucomicrobiota bacterium]